MMILKINRREQYQKTRPSAVSWPVTDRYDHYEGQPNLRSAASVLPSTEEDADRWVAQQLFEHYNG